MTAATSAALKPAPAPVVVSRSAQGAWWRGHVLPPLALLAVLIVVMLAALAVGRYAISPARLFGLLTGWGDVAADGDLEERIVALVRLPRVLLAAVVGAGLAGAGAALQSLFRNPLAEPQLLGVSSGAAFGGVLAFILAGDGWPVAAGAFAWGVGALLAVFWLAGGARSGPAGGTVLLVLAGIVVSAVFSAGVSLVKLVADPQNQLPAIVFWLMGSLAAANLERLWLALPCIGAGLLLLFGLRFHLSALSLGDDDARALGVPVRRVRILALGAIGVIVAASVAVCGVVGWVGLVVPHLVRMSFGVDHRCFLLNTLLGGAIYLIVVDTLARSAAAVEIPLGVLTALLGAPLFALLVRRLGRTVTA